MTHELVTWGLSFADRSVRPVEVALHAAPATGRIVVMMLGWKGAIDGFARKYEKLADLLVGRGVAAVVRQGNHPIAGLPFAHSSADQLRGVVSRARAEALALCGAEAPEIFLFGMSAGGSAVAVCAAEMAAEKVLLVAPSADCGRDAMERGLADFTGELRVVSGDVDRVVSRQFAETVSRMAPRACNTDRFVLLAGCDHQFRGEVNGRILSQSLLWAFAGDTPFPDPSRGIELY